jgi:pyridoxine/pyridoxamine 5'-phosphate oxidase
MSPLNGDKRRHQRQKSIAPFAYRVPLSSPGIRIAITANISDSGMCIYTESTHNKGEIIEIRSSFPVSYLWAAVRWVKKDAANLYKMGLMFME